MERYVKYKRVSTKKQGDSGLGIEAQDYIINYFVKPDDMIVGNFTEVYTGTELSNCVELRKAIDCCKQQGAKLIIAKSDRFRNVSEALQILDELGEGNLICCDVPGATRFIITLFWALAEREALITSLRTQAALNSIKERIKNEGSHVSKSGNVIKKLGNPYYMDSVGIASEASVAAKEERYVTDPKRINAYLIAKELKANGMSLRKIADRLNTFTAETLPKDIKKWNAMNVRRLFSNMDGCMCNYTPIE